MARVKAKVSVKGIRPYLHHAFGPDSIPLERREKTGKAGNDPEEWKRTVRATADNQLYIRNDQFWASVRDGSKHVKKGRGSIQKDVIATLLVEGKERIMTNRYLPDSWQNMEPFGEDTDEVYVDSRYCKNPSTRAGNFRYRVAMSPGWEANFVISWDNTIISANAMQEAVINAGILCGVGDGRNIGMGRYEIVSFEILDGEAD